GDTDMPEAPISAGSMTVESVGSAVQAACLEARERLVVMARDDPVSPLAGVAPNDIVVEDGRLQSAADPRRGEPVAALIARHGGQPVEAEADSKPGPEAQ